MKFNFPVIIVDKDFRTDNLSGSGMRDLAEAIEKEGTTVVAATHANDFLGLAQQAARVPTRRVRAPRSRSPGPPTP